MKRLLGLAMSAAWMLLVSAGPGLQAGESSSSAREVAFVSVNVVPMDRNRVLNNQTVLVRDGRIAAVGPAGSTVVPDGALQVEGRDKYLMQGLAEMHGHIPPPT
jgi:imidazolonepropionase-like amidohydrolase